MLFTIYSTLAMFPAGSGCLNLLSQKVRLTSSDGSLATDGSNVFGETCELLVLPKTIVVLEPE